MRSVKAFDGSRIALRESHLGGDVSVTLGAMRRTYPYGDERIEFCRGKSGNDWYIWSVHRQQRLASYRTRRELEEEWQRWSSGA